MSNYGRISRTRTTKFLFFLNHRDLKEQLPKRKCKIKFLFIFYLPKVGKTVFDKKIEEFFFSFSLCLAFKKNQERVYSPLSQTSESLKVTS